MKKNTPKVWVEGRKPMHGQVVLKGKSEDPGLNRLGDRWEARVTVNHKTSDLTGALLIEKGGRTHPRGVTGKLVGNRFWFLLQGNREGGSVIFVLERDGEKMNCRGLWAFLRFLRYEDVAQESLTEIAEGLQETALGGKTECTLPRPTGKCRAFRDEEK
ncbi:MAG: hypothetical protein PHV93_02135 [Candidatus Pacebacteria bacterium]|nr:hypothetical protein [Candidatus Paceibacterota bacterium]